MPTLKPDPPYFRSIHCPTPTLTDSIHKHHQSTMASGPIATVPAANVEMDPAVKRESISAEACFNLENLAIHDQKMGVDEARTERKSDSMASNKSNQSIGPMDEFLAHSLIRHDPNTSRSNIPFAKALGNTKVIGFYFASYSSTGSRAFTQTLSAAYSKWTEHGHSIEIVFVSQNENEAEFNVDFRDHHGKWLAVEWDEKKQKTLAKQLDVDGVPSLIFVNRDWDIISRNGIIAVFNCWENAANQLLAEHQAIERLHEHDILMATLAAEEDLSGGSGAELLREDADPGDPIMATEKQSRCYRCCFPWCRKGKVTPNGND